MRSASPSRRPSNTERSPHGCRRQDGGTSSHPEEPTSGARPDDDARGVGRRGASGVVRLRGGVPQAGRGPGPLPGGAGGRDRGLDGGGFAGRAPGRDHAADWPRWGRMGGLRVLELYGPAYFVALARRRWRRITAEQLARVREWLRRAWEAAA